MRIRLTAAFLVAAALGCASAPSQAARTDTATATHERQSDGNSDLIWNLIGCLGLIGIFGMWRNTDNDGYTDDPI